MLKIEESDEEIMHTQSINIFPLSDRGKVSRSRSQPTRVSEVKVHARVSEGVVRNVLEVQVQTTTQHNTVALCCVTDTRRHLGLVSNDCEDPVRR